MKKMNRNSALNCRKTREIRRKILADGSAGTKSVCFHSSIRQKVKPTRFVFIHVVALSLALSIVRFTNKQVNNRSDDEREEKRKQIKVAFSLGASSHRRIRLLAVCSKSTSIVCPKISLKMNETRYMQTDFGIVTIWMALLFFGVMKYDDDFSKTVTGTLVNRPFDSYWCSLMCCPSAS